jgi:transposase-like protein
MGRVANLQLRSEWRARLERWQKSGLGVREFCAAEDVGEPSFYQWRKKLGVKAGERRETNAAAPITSLQQALFLPLEITRATSVDSSSPIEIELPTGCKIRVSAGVSREQLALVLETLQRRDS